MSDKIPGNTKKYQGIILALCEQP